MEIIQYIPVASKDFGIDQASQLNKQLYVYRIDIDKKYNIIEIKYEIVLLAPTGIIVSILEYGSYLRDDNTVLKHFTSLQAGPLGQGITNSIKLDMNDIQSFNTYKNDLVET